MRGKVRDLGDLFFGDPWDASRAEGSERRDEVDIRNDLEELRQKIDLMPADALGPALEPTGWNEEFNGPWERQGLTDEQKQIIWDQATRTWDAETGESIVDARYSQRHMDANVRRDVEDSAFETALWREYARAFPELARDEAGVRRAVDAVVESQKRYGTPIGLWAREKPREFIEAVKFEQELQRDIGRQWEGDPRNTDGGRTSGLSGWGSNTPGAAATSGEGKSDMIEDLRAIQKRSGFFD